MDVFGLDLGTNSIGWALVDSANEIIRYQGVRIFQEGVRYDNKGNDVSLAAQRTVYRARRRILFRRRLRKIETLKVLVELQLCPPLTDHQLSQWKLKKIYPQSDEFRKWWLTNEQEGKNPYADRYRCVTQKLDLTKEQDRYTLGRALYHLSQRRGFLSNRLEQTKENEAGKVKEDIDKLSKQTKENEAGKVKKDIDKLSKQIEESGCQYLGEYFYTIYGKEKIRGCYTSRLEHYQKEFQGICEKQELPEEWGYLLRRAIFYQRPLKSQKGSVAKCKFEPAKPCAPISHPLFEEYRMWAFIQNIKIKTENDEQLRDLTKEEIELIIPLFYRKKEEYFDFEDIANELAGKKTIGHYKNAQDRAIKQVLFNYELDTTVTACITCMKLRNVFGENWKEELVNRYTDKTTKLGQKTEAEIIQDIWHVLFTFDSEVKLREFAQVKLGVSEETAEKFTRISLKQGYASLSLKAIKKISYWLQSGLTYAHSVFMANIPYILPQEIWAEVSNQELIVSEIKGLIDSYTTTKKQFEIINSIVKSSRDSNSTWGDSDLLAAEYRKDVENKLSQFYGKSEWLSKSQQERDQEVDRLFVMLEQQMVKHGGKGDYIKIPTLKEEIIRFLSDQFDLSDQSLAKLYHPSEVTPFAPARKNDDGIYQLGSPRISSVKNPVVMRAMFQLRKLINELLAQHIITEFTPIRVEMARELNDANKRRAIKLYQDGRQKKRESYKKKIIELVKTNCNIDYVPNDDDILKYELWLEQNKQCLYTGDTICICDFVGADPKYDIEHTIPQSVSFDNSRVNKTICQNRFNRETKNNRLPSQLANHDAILIRVSHWNDQIDAIKKNIKKADYRVKVATTKEEKDDAIVDRHLLKMDLDYWTRKYNTFVIKEVKDGFKNSQLVDTGSITRYTLFYLKSLFKRVDVLKGSATADLRKLWGIQDEFEVKSRETHLHHAVDAIVLASVPRNISDLLQQYYLDKEREHGVRKSFRKPWNTFVEDIKTSQEDILVDHVNRDNLLKTTKKKLRKRGAILRNKDGLVKITQGHSARGALHQEKPFGAICINNEVVYVKRCFVSKLDVKDIEKIIDPVVRQKVEEAVKKKGVAALKGIIWMNEDKKIQIKKVRYRTAIKNPIIIKRNRDYSTREYRNYQYTVNPKDSSYKMLIFEDQKEKNQKKGMKRHVVVVSNCQAIQLRCQSGKDMLQKIKELNHIPLHYKLIYEISKGSKVLLWEECPEELFLCKPNDLQKRYYLVKAFNLDPRKTTMNSAIVLFSNIYAIQSSENKTKSGTYKENVFLPFRKMSHNQFNALVEGIDFKFNILGGIEKIE